jgi:20S proteasome alpha/beta subunit
MKTPILEADLEAPHFWPPVFLQPAEPGPIIAPMTVGIGAICESGNAIVMAADRLSTVGEASLVVDHGNVKLVQLSPQMMVTITGTLQEAEYVSERLRHVSSLLSLQSVHQVAKRLKRACAHIRDKQIEDRIIRPNLGISFTDFSKACLNNATTPIISDIFNRIGAHKFQLELLLSGMDDSGSHLYLIGSMGINSYEGMGYVAVGIGATLATVSLTKYGGNCRAWSLPDAVYRTYEAKRESEGTNLVGAMTDMMVLRKGGKPAYLSPELVESLRRIYESKRPPELTDDERGSINGGLQ